MFATDDGRGLTEVILSGRECRYLALGGALPVLSLEDCGSD
jgi:hypothetical protein